MSVESEISFVEYSIEFSNFSEKVLFFPDKSVVTCSFVCLCTSCSSYSFCILFWSSLISNFQFQASMLPINSHMNKIHLR
jgi:hypothetical protein